MGAALKAARQTSPLRQADVAAAVGVAPKTYEQWEQGYVSIKASYIPLIAGAIGWTPERLLGVLSAALAETGVGEPAELSARTERPRQQSSSTPNDRAAEEAPTRAARLAQVLQKMLTRLAYDAGEVDRLARLAPGTTSRILNQQGRLPTPPVLWAIAGLLESDYTETPGQQQSDTFGTFVRLMGAAGYWSRHRTRQSTEYQRLISRVISDGIELKSTSDGLQDDVESLEHEYEESVDELDELKQGDTIDIDEIEDDDERERAEELESRIDELEWEIENAKEEHTAALAKLSEYIGNRLSPTIAGQLVLGLFGENEVDDAPST